MRFESPWMFLLLLGLPALLWWRQRRMGPGAAIRFSWTQNAARAGASLRQRLGFIPPLLRLIALALLVIALARPQLGMEHVRETNEGIAIEMVLDRSSSMAAEMNFEGRRRNRLEVVKEVFKTFVLGDGKELKGRGNDLIGMISFAQFPETVCPLTLGHGALPQFLETVRLAAPKSQEDGTAIGDAVALAAARLKTAEETLARQLPDAANRFEIKSKVMILLSDGQQTAGKRRPLDSAKLSKEWGIKIYAIAVTGKEEMQSQNTFFGRFLQLGTAPQLDTRDLEAVAKETGGKFFLAEDAKSLGNIYKEIDALERSGIESVRYMDYRELFAPFAVLALLLVALETGLNCTIFRKIP
jgi:Ca-activated chloride channel family protein